ncbi:NAD(P)H-dependent oxidoreductase [Cellulomonas edaphi]|uniref:NAD(P)H-dependent oxidoreductase n=1 Tax=Cellulomonas edaphi TaxID=3053468 RepID=A0ABT7S8G5_9CELL|nr:NAD(P)H-dependent oxidoreductase [Cellulomons edaphi]MDM7831322.1 NAD(P)H-dependent oxidoreductase [Cellulomons edaphi]
MSEHVIALSGNPRAGSRTTAAATAVADRLAASVLDGEAVRTIDLSALAGEIFAAEHPAADEALAALRSARLLVVATPVYKASYTGLLKAFLDLYGPNGLAGVVAVPLVVSGNPAHALAGEVHLRPLLVELGAVVPTRSITVLDSQLAQLDEALDGWLAGGALESLTAALQPVAAGVAR